MVSMVLSVVNVSGTEAVKETKKVLLINSYGQGYDWTDSLTSEIIGNMKKQPGVDLYITNLNAKIFGQTRFEQERNYIRDKYAGVHFDGVIVTDNDALDFAFKYDKELFPGCPVVFAGISNPQDYPLDHSNYYGFVETGSDEGIIAFVRTIMPGVNRMLVLADLTTTGKIYRENIARDAARVNGFSVSFPEVIDLDSICKTVSSDQKYDAIYYLGINQDKDGRGVGYKSLLNKICRLAKVPVFCNDPLANGNGVVGGLYQSGKKHGLAAARLIIQLMDPSVKRPSKRFDTTEKGYFFDRKMMNQFDIPISRVPIGSKVINNPTRWTRTNFKIMIFILSLLSLLIVFLLVANRRRKAEHRRSYNQFLESEMQRNELAEAYEQLSKVLSELENANKKLRDINVNLLEAKKKAEESDNLKSAFLANVSHEIRTPLNSIVGFSSLLSESDLKEETRNLYIDLIESNSESLLVLIDEILDLSKIEAQQLTLKLEDFSMDSLMTELLNIFVHSNKNPKVELKISRVSETRELFVHADRVRTKQIFINLISNAMKFTDSGIIQFGYFCNEHQEIVLYVRDSGIGIKEEHQQVIFDRFMKLNVDGTKIYRGTGLGLAITKKLVELLGGKIWLESEPGYGTVFFFTLHPMELR